ncbi:MAG: hypothetical protein D0531_11315 [Methylococcales bacterium]|nr:MAG: hypothetical protein D0531_11315 [Methylococcales bacterium]
MITDKQKIEIAISFMQLHPTTVSAWSPDKEYESDDEQHLSIYDNLIMGVYGDCYGINAEYDEDGELLTEATEFEIEVVQFETPNDPPEKFTFEIYTEPTEFSKFIEDHGKNGNW